MSKVIDILQDPSFSYERPWFYNHPLALRCELGSGNRQYKKNALRRAIDIYTILFEGKPDAFFFHHSISDWDDEWQDVYPKAILRHSYKSLSFSLKAQKQYHHTVVRNVLFDSEDTIDIARINRIICYPDNSYNPLKQIRRQVNGKSCSLIHFVSEKNECIFSIYDDRGCDIVFFSKEKLQEFYPLLQPYFLAYDLELMQERWKSVTQCST